MCSVPSVCSRISRTARGPSSRRSALTIFAVLLVGAGEHLGRVRDQRDQVGHLRLHVGHRGDQARRAGRLGEADVEAQVGAAVLLEVLGLRRHRLDQLVEPVEPRRPGPLGGEQDRARLDRDPLVEHLPGAGVERLADRVDQRRLGGDEGAALAAAQARPGGRSGPGW